MKNRGKQLLKWSSYLIWDMNILSFGFAPPQLNKFNSPTRCSTLCSWFCYPAQRLVGREVCGSSLPTDDGFDWQGWKGWARLCWPGLVCNERGHWTEFVSVFESFSSVRSLRRTAITLAELTRINAECMCVDPIESYCLEVTALTLWRFYLPYLVVAIVAWFALIHAFINVAERRSVALTCQPSPVNTVLRKL